MFQRVSEKSCTLPCGVILLILGIMMTIWTPFYLLVCERLRMVPGLPAFDWWKEPPEQLTISFYIFNVTNADRYINGEDPKLHMEEIGPIVFMEKWIHDDIIFNKNSTMSYTITHLAKYMPELNTVDLNASITVANVPVLAAVSSLWNMPFFSKFVLKAMITALNSKPLIQTTVYNYLFNWTDPLTDVINKILPSLVPDDNIGFVNILYKNFTDRLTVYIGKKHGHEKFLLIDKYNGGTSVIGHGNTCKENLLDASEGLTFNQFITKETILRYYRKSLCRVVPIYFIEEMERFGIHGYKFSFRNDSFDRTQPPEDDCHKGHPELPDGLTDLSKCFFDFPFAASFPHFLYGDPKLKQYVTGMKPNRSLHESYTILEPISGIPMESVATSQCNLVVRPISDFDEPFDKFSDMVIPMFWIAYTQTGLPDRVRYLLTFSVNILPVAQWVAIGIMLTLGILFIWLPVGKSIKRIQETSKSSKLDVKLEQVLNKPST